MARGKVVAAADFPTANEYISNENGYLFDVENLSRLAVSDFARKAEISHSKYVEGAKRSAGIEEELLRFVKDSGSPFARMLTVAMHSVLSFLGVGGSRLRA